MYICCGLKDRCVSMKNAVGELTLTGVNKPPWRNCWGTMDSIEWLLQSKGVNGVCVFVHVCHLTSIVMKTTASFFFSFFNFSPHFHCKRVNTRTYIWPRLRAGPKHSSSQERVLEVTRRAQIQDSTGPQSKRTKHCFGTVIIRKYYVHISKLKWWCQGTLTATGQSFFSVMSGLL